MTILAAVVLVLAQNCSPSVGVKHQSSKLENNGSGYTGKLVNSYVSYAEQSVCADGSPYRARIDLFENGHYYLVRNECVQVAAVQITPDQVLGPNQALPDLIIYLGRGYESLLSPNAGALADQFFRLDCTSQTAATAGLSGSALVAGARSTRLAPTGDSVWVIGDCDLNGNCAVMNNCFVDSIPGGTFTGNAECIRHAATLAAANGDSVRQGRGNPLQSCRVLPR